MNNKLYIIASRIAGIAGCVLDIIIQVGLTVASVWRKESETQDMTPLDPDTEKFYHK